jgi:hypothetical protein
MSIELAGLASSFSVLNTITKATIGLRDAAKLNDKIVEFQQAMIEANSHVIAAQQEYFSMARDVQKLKDDNKRLKDWSAEKTKYQLREIGEGVFVYMENDTVGTFESAHKFCCNCFDQEIKSLLQQSREPSRRVGLNCIRCKAKLVFDCYKDWKPRDTTPQF